MPKQKIVGNLTFMCNEYTAHTLPNKGVWQQLFPPLLGPLLRVLTMDHACEMITDRPNSREEMAHILTIPSKSLESNRLVVENPSQNSTFGMCVHTRPVKSMTFHCIALESGAMQRQSQPQSHTQYQHQYNYNTVQ